MDELERLRQENQELRAKVAELEGTVKNLVEQLKQDSHNSSWPSSRDKGRKRQTRSLRQKSDRAVGGQKGHKGHTLAKQAKPDVIEIHRPLECAHCHQEIEENATVSGVKKRQVLDLPPLRFITTEHRAEAVVCSGCGEITEASFPEEVKVPVQYGPGVKQLAVYLHNEQFIPYARTQQFLSDLFHLPTSVGSLQNFIAAGAKRVEPVVELIKQAVTQIEVGHVDETGFYVGGKRHWLHTVSNGQLSYYASHRRRGQVATDEIGILPRFTGVLVHDAWATYFKYSQATHALCHAHHLRNLIAIIENDQQKWAQWMCSFLLAAKALVQERHEAGLTQFPQAQLVNIHRLYDVIVKQGLAENPLPDKPPPKGKRGRRQKSKARNLVERFDKRKSMMLLFIHDFKVPFDNNLAERDIRMMKVQQKVSGCFRSESGASQFCQLRSYTATMRKQGLNVWDALGSLFSDQPQFPQLTPV